MLRIIEYLRLLGLRPLELLKSFDKTMSFELPRQDFVEQIKVFYFVYMLEHYYETMPCYYVFTVRLYGILVLIGLRKYCS